MAGKTPNEKGGTAAQHERGDGAASGGNARPATTTEGEWTTVSHKGKRAAKTAQPGVKQVHQRKHSQPRPSTGEKQQRAAPTTTSGQRTARFASSAPAWGGAGMSASKISLEEAAAGHRNAQQLRQYQALESEAPTIAMAAMQFIATRPTPLHRDEALRSMTIQERGAFDAYLNGKVELAAPPQFLRATVPRLVRHQVMAFHEERVEGMLNTKVPAGVRMNKRTSYKALVSQLEMSNRPQGQPDPTLEVFLQAVKRMDYDHETRLLTVVTSTRRLAEAWHGCCFHLQHGVLDFTADTRAGISKETDSYSATSLTRKYKLRVKCATAITALDIEYVFGVKLGAPVLVLERGSASNADKYDRQNWSLTLQSDRCPPKLEGVNHIGTDRGELFIHHADVHVRPPCFRCFGNSHPVATCKVEDPEMTRAIHHRDIVFPRTAVKKMDIEFLRQVGIDQFIDVITSTGKPNPTGGKVGAGATKTATTEIKVKVLSRRAKKRAAAKMPTAVTSAITGDFAAGPTKWGANNALWPPLVGAELERVRRAATVSPSAAATGKRHQERHPRVPGAKTVGEVKQYATTPEYKVRGRKSKFTDLGTDVLVKPAAPREFDGDDATTGMADEIEAAPTGGGAVMNNLETPCLQATVSTPGAAGSGRPGMGETAEDGAQHDPLQGEAAVVVLEEMVINSSDAFVPPPAQDHAMAQLHASWRRKSLKQFKAAARATEVLNGSRRSVKQQHGRVRSPATADGKPKVMVESRNSREGLQKSMFQYYKSSSADSQTRWSELLSFTPAASLSSGQEPPPEGSVDTGDSTVLHIGGREATEPPILLDDWLECFDLHVVDVPANGHCFYGAFFAATAGAADDRTLEYVDETLTGVQACRDLILFVAADQVKVEAHMGGSFVAEQRALAQDLFPTEGWTIDSDPVAIAARLVRHYEEIEADKITNTVPRRHWARPAEIGAAALVLREPLYVLDVLPDNVVRAQRYSYCEERPIDGVHTESRFHSNVPMAVLTAFVSACLKNRVLLPLLILRHTATGGVHFQALRFADLLYERYMHSETSQTKPCMRERLDEVHAARGHQRVDATPRYEFPATEPDIVNEAKESAVTVAKVSIAVRQAGVTPETKAEGERKAVRAKLLRAEAITYDRVLQLQGNLDDGSIADRKKFTSMVRANQKALAGWRAQLLRDSVPNVPATIEALAEVDVTNRPLFKHCLDLFQLLPHGALAAQQLGAKLMCKWGACLSQLAQLRTPAILIDDDDQPKAAREAAVLFHSAVSTCADEGIRKRLLHDVSRWKALRVAKATFASCCKPKDTRVPEWELSNVLPYLLWNWRPSEVNCVDPEDGWISIGAIKQYYADNDRADCVISRILTSNDWSGTRLAGIADADTSSSTSCIDAPKGTTQGAPPVSTTQRYGHGSGDRVIAARAATRTKQTPVTSHYEQITAGARRNDVERELKQLRKEEINLKKLKAKPGEQLVTIFTQNVRSLTVKDSRRRDWFQAFQSKQDGQLVDLIFLQETRVNASEMKAVATQHCLHWGRVVEERATPLSYWSAAVDASGGVGILVNPDSTISNVRPWLENAWTAHWMALTAELDGAQMYIYNVYAPVRPLEREPFYRALATAKPPEGANIIVGGDFNCTQDGATDRTHKTDKDEHHSAALAKLLRQWGLQDTAADAAEKVHNLAELGEFCADYHTYFYRMASGKIGSSRLDRWYTSAQLNDWVRSTTTLVPGPPSDHNGVLLRLSNPRLRRRKKIQTPAFPLPGYAAAKADEYTGKALADFAERLAPTSDGTRATAIVWARWWDELKVTLREQYRSIRRDCKRRILDGHRQRQRRLRVAIARLAVSGGNTTPEDDVLLLQANLASKIQQQQAMRRTLLLVRHGSRQSTTKDLFRRISTRNIDNTVAALRRGDGSLETQSTQLPNVMAEGWRATINPAPVSTDWDAAWVVQYAAQSVPGLEVMDAVITDAEVLKALRSCKRGKTPGPDGLGNDWYRDTEQQLVDILLTMFRTWSEHGVFPASFTTANILGLKKKASAMSPLEFRPIALLNTDYKVYTRIQATRLRRHAWRLVHPLQNGFIPRRTIHTTLDAYYAVRERVQAKKIAVTAKVFFVDFEKAYDSVGRAFILWHLRNIGFSPRFVAIVAALHENTSCRFLVNGFESKTMAITTGIRQGCPLAPLLFVLALDPLYSRIERSTEIGGLLLDTTSSKHRLKVAGYADDTAIFLQDTAELPSALRILTEFAKLSGLKVNVTKSVCVPLGPDGDVDQETVAGVPMLQRNATCRYLGIRVGAHDTHDENWRLCLAATAARIALAVAKTHTVQQRVLIANSIIVSKVVYLARHMWPDRKMVERLHKMVKQFVWGTRQGKVKRAWMKEQIAELAPRHGGLGLPHVYTALQQMSAKVVGQWAAGADERALFFGDILLCPSAVNRQYITPEHLASEPRLVYKSDLWSMGKATLAAAHGTKSTATLRRLLDNHAGSTSTDAAKAQWIDGTWKFVASMETKRSASEAATELRMQLGPHNSLWLPLLDVTVKGALWESGDTEVKLQKWTYCNNRTRLDQLVQWTWVEHGTVLFRPVSRAYPLGNEHARQFKRLCRALVVTYPFLLHRPARPDQLIPVPHEKEAEHEWQIEQTEGVLHILPNGNLSQRSQSCRTMSACDTVARGVTGDKQFQFMAHPTLTRLVQIWSGTNRWRPSRAKVAAVAGARRQKAGKDESVRREGIYDSTDGEMSSGLARLSWTQLQRMTPGSSVELQTYYRLKQGSLARWTGHLERDKCVHEGCEAADPTAISHWFWSCRAARELWATNMGIWQQIHGVPWASLRAKLFSLQLDEIPPRAADVLVDVAATEQARGLQYDALAPVLRFAWSGTVLAIVHGLWTWRSGLIHGSDYTPMVRRVMAFERVEQRVRALTMQFQYSTEPAEAAAQRAVMVRLVRMGSAECPEPTPGPLMGLTEYVCFFDGGSRGNPGPGGAGSVLVAVDRASRSATVIWFAAMAYSNRRTTNNIAEYWGLLHGLQHAVSAGLRPLHVVGDSSLIINQVRCRKKPRAAHLVRLHTQATRLAAAAGILTWQHHLRAHNKMADAAANIAMDNASSIQSEAGDGRAELALIEPYLMSDIGHWFSRVDQR